MVTIGNPSATSSIIVLASSNREHWLIKTIKDQVNRPRNLKHEVEKLFFNSIECEYPFKFVEICVICDIVV